MISAFGVNHGGEVSKKAGGLLKPAGQALAQAGKRRGAVTVTGGAQTGGKYRAGALPYKGKHAG